MNDEHSLWYFAYGSNMARAPLARQGLVPLDSRPALLAGYRRRFNHPGLPPADPVFANVEPCPGAVVLGVVHRLPAPAAALLDRLEPDYVRHPARVYLDSNRAVDAYTYISATPGHEGIPSARYLHRLIAGAREHHLPADLIAEWEWLLRLAPAPAASPLTLLFGPPLVAPAGSRG